MVVLAFGEGVGNRFEIFEFKSSLDCFSLLFYVYSLNNMCVRVFVSFHLLYYSSLKSSSLRSECKLDQVDFRDWMPFLAFTLMEEIIPTQKSQKRKCLRSRLVESSVNTDHAHR